MGRSPAPTPAELELLDPDGKFRQRLETDRQTILQLLETGNVGALLPIIHRLAGAAGTFGFAEVGDISIALDDAAVAGEPPSPGGVRPLLVALAHAIETSA